ncbi:MAG TPA: hypothetical protein VKM55_19160 [Candidatus Lokiarchaeia archaeon]|nr:hypothetical protein [Candidatus Lokiarchaeia archaeon]
MRISEQEGRPEAGWLPLREHGQGPGEHPGGSGGESVMCSILSWHKYRGSSNADMWKMHAATRLGTFGSSCMQGNPHVQFLGGEGLVTARTYPARESNVKKIVEYLLVKHPQAPERVAKHFIVKDSARVRKKKGDTSTGLYFSRLVVVADSLIFACFSSIYDALMKSSIPVIPTDITIIIRARLLVIGL